MHGEVKGVKEDSGPLQLLLGKIEPAVRLLEESLDESRAKDVGAHVLHALGQRAYGALAQNDPALASALLIELLDLAIQYRMDRDTLSTVAGLAAMALVTEDLVTAANLLGAMASARASFAIGRIYNAAHADRTMAETRSALGDEAVEAAFSAGVTMTYEETIATARAVGTSAATRQD